MNCIFCQEATANSKSVEHIVPESLGNKDFVLGKGWVCDQCNNYFAVKIERPLLELPFFTQHRHDLNIESKKGRIPCRDAFLLDETNSKVNFQKSKNKEEKIEVDSSVLQELLSKGIDEIPAIIITFGAPENNILLSKFLGKVGIELLAYEAILYGYDDLYYNQKSLGNIKRYVRKGQKNELWPYVMRQLYHPDAGFKDESGYLKVICTWKFILTKDQELLLQFLFVGTEFTIDLINPDTKSIEHWHTENEGKSLVLESLIRRYGGNSLENWVVIEMC